MTKNKPLINGWLLVLRLSVAGFMLTHGWPKLMKLLEGGEIQFGDPIGLGPWASLALAAFAEAICSILIALGLFTRLATIPLIITMITAVVIVHGEDPFGRKELALLYLLIYITLLVFGGGSWSADKILRKK
jgi:putative oxidoreductase